MIYWKKYSSKKLADKIDKSLQGNVDFSNDTALGYPASKLDENVFYHNAPFLKDAPLLKTFVANPNHIGCHTVGESEHAFKGTQKLERETLDVIAVDIFNAKPNEFDGYMATGGTEANIQALWVYRNYFIKTFGATFSEIAIISSEDTHYSIPKGANILGIENVIIPVDFETRIIKRDVLSQRIQEAQNNGKKYFIVISNMATTMFGSVDNPNLFVSVLKEFEVEFKIHIDGAYGGFVYPFSKDREIIDFTNPHISSITIDAHKMLQAPYGTGVFLTRKGLIENVLTEEAQYVNGMDLTLCGSRSGANALAVWMILFSYGPHKWFEKISVLLMRTNWFCDQLKELGIDFYRHPNMNIVTMKSDKISKDIAEKFNLVPETHSGNNKWYKVVIMDHVEIDHLDAFLKMLKQSLLVK
ncbi:pyridoxal phosphate-dependent decarboxylase family protein [Urechidicola croceus]|uniref:Aspartate aminotransferase family protein n=1 Tax=Urechidicola croceus TaxID=1850246 RepID=A0A1D8PC00_9FLAO|nr:pyridoxal-dependent decarboxylase [Urechidicola croceus]AOW22070.1 aspartate aminotransferase family protein [Urechidicola croceus]